MIDYNHNFAKGANVADKHKLTLEEAERLRQKHKEEIDNGEVDKDFLEFANQFSDPDKYNDVFEFAYGSNEESK